MLTVHNGKFFLRFYIIIWNLSNLFNKKKIKIIIYFGMQAIKKNILKYENLYLFSYFILLVKPPTRILKYIVIFFDFNLNLKIKFNLKNLIQYV